VYARVSSIFLKSSFNCYLKIRLLGEEAQMDKEQFRGKYKQVILDWAKDNKLRLIEGRKKYSWKNEGPSACLAERNKISKEIIFSRLHHAGGITLETLDIIMASGGFSQFPLRDKEKVLEVTQRAFDFVDKGQVS
jgi:hypothetical protein